MDYKKYDDMAKNEIANNVNGNIHEVRRNAYSHAHNAFFDDAKKELGIENNPKADLLMNIAWERGHSYGYAEVFSVAVDMVDLIKN